MLLPNLRENMYIINVYINKLWNMIYNKRYNMWYPSFCISLLGSYYAKTKLANRVHDEPKSNPNLPNVYMMTSKINKPSIEIYKTKYGNRKTRKYYYRTKKYRNQEITNSVINTLIRQFIHHQNFNFNIVIQI